MKISKLLAGMSAAAIVASMLSMVSISADNEKTETTIDSIKYSFTVKTVDKATSISFNPSANGMADSVGSVDVDKAGDYTVTVSDINATDGLQNLGYFAATDDAKVELTVTSVTVNNDYTIDVNKDLNSLEAYQNGLENKWGTYDGDTKLYSSDKAEIDFIKKDGVIKFFTIGESAPSDDYVVPADYISADGTVVYLAGDAAKNENGPFNDKIDELAKYDTVTVTMSMDEAAVQECLTKGTWIGGGMVFASESTGWDTKYEWTPAANIKPITLAKVSDGVYTATYTKEGGIFASTDTYAQVVSQDWTDASTFASYTKAKITGLTLSKSASNTTTSATTTVSDTTTTAATTVAPTEDLPDFDVPSDYFKQEAGKTTVYLAGDEAKGENGPFNEKMDELAKYSTVQFTVQLDEKEAQDCINHGNTWVGGGLGFNSESTGWEGHEWTPQQYALDDDGNKIDGPSKELTLEKVSDGVYTVTYTKPNGTIFDANDTYAQVWMQDWSTKNAKLIGVKFIGAKVPEKTTIDSKTFLMYTSGNWTWSNPNLYGEKSDDDKYGRGSDAEITKDGTYTVSVNKDNLSYFYGDNSDLTATPETDGAVKTDIGDATGANVICVDMVGLADQIGASTKGLKLKTSADKQAVAEAKGLKITNVVLSVDGKEFYTPKTSEYFFGDIEDKGNIRLELFNTWGETANNKELKAIYDKIVATDSVSVSFDIAGLPKDPVVTTTTTKKTTTKATTTTAKKATTKTTTTTKANGGNGNGGSNNANTGFAASFATLGAALAAAAAIVTKKRK